MPNNYLSVLNKHRIQVENKNVGLKVGGGGTNIPLPPQSKKSGGGGVHGLNTEDSNFYLNIRYNCLIIDVYSVEIGIFF